MSTFEALGLKIHAQSFLITKCNSENDRIRIKDKEGKRTKAEFNAYD